MLTRTNALISQLQSESDTPLTFHINDDDGDMSVCAYTLPNDSSITALLVADDSDINYNHDFLSLNEPRTRARQSFVKQILNIS